MIGIHFEIPNEWNNYLNLILGNINTENYNWLISDEEIYLEGLVDLFRKSIYDNISFKKTISGNKHYLIVGNVAAFKSLNCKDIYNYEDFQNSDCEILMIIVDSCSIDIYVKDKKILEQIKNNAINNKFRNVEYIKEESKRIFHI